MKLSTSDDEFIDILSLRKSINFTPPPGLTYNLSKLNPRYADLLVLFNQQAQQKPAAPKLTIFNNQKKMSDSCDEFGELTAQMKQLHQPEIVIQPKLEDQERRSQVSEKENTGQAQDKKNQKSRQLQSKYQQASDELKTTIFAENIRGNIVQYSLDKYDHYVIEKVLDVGLVDHKNQIFDKVYELRHSFSKDMYASKVVQKCLEVSSKDSKIHFQLFVKYIIGDPVSTKQMSVDKLGSQLIQKALEIFESENLLNLLEILQQNIVMELSDDACHRNFDTELCTNQFGCLVVNKLIEVQPKQIQTKIKLLINQIIEKIINACPCLSRKQYSNYIIQQILEKGQDSHKQQLLEKQILKDFVSLSTDKYGSNVAEKSIIYGGTAWRIKVWDEVNTANTIVKNLVNDHFANYVMQKLYEYLPEAQQNKFGQIIAQLNKKQQLNVHGQMVMKFIEQIKLEQYQQQDPSSKSSLQHFYYQQYYYPQQMIGDAYFYQQQLSAQPIKSKEKKTKKK